MHTFDGQITPENRPFAGGNGHDINGQRVDPFDELENESTLINALEAFEKKLRSAQNSEHKFEGFFPDWNNEPPDVPPLLTLNGLSVLTAGNVSTLIAQTGSGKSRVCESILATAIYPNAKHLGICAQIQDGEKCLYFDTERPKKETWKGWARSMYRAGYRRGQTPPETLTYVNLIDPPPTERREIIEGLVLIKKPKLVIIDGVIDLLPTGDFNSIAESFETVGWLVRLANQNDLGILATIHSNPTDPDLKAKGHTGVKLMEKSEFVLGLQKFSDGTRYLSNEFAFGKNRSGEKSGVYFSWQSANGYSDFEVCDAPDPSAIKAENELQKWLGFFKSIFESESASFQHNELVKKLAEKSGTKEDNCKKKVKNYLENGYLINEFGVYRLKESTN